MPFCVSVVNYGSETAMVKQNVTDTDEYGLLQQELSLCALPTNTPISMEAYW